MDILGAIRRNTVITSNFTPAHISRDGLIVWGNTLAGQQVVPPPVYASVAGFPAFTTLALNMAGIGPQAGYRWISDSGLDALIQHFPDYPTDFNRETWMYNSGVWTEVPLAGGGFAHSLPFEISGDGTTAALMYQSPNKPARWSAAGGIEFLTFPDWSIGTPKTTILRRVSYDGSALCGNRNSGFGSTQMARYWSESLNHVDLGWLPGGVDSVATAISADGLIVCGYSNKNGVELVGPYYPWLWNGGSLVDLGFVATGASGIGNGLNNLYMSADGSVIAGNDADNFNGWHWNSTDGVVAIFPSWSYNQVVGLSANGVYALLQGNSPSNSGCFRYNLVTGQLIHLPMFNTVADISADGSVILGTAVENYPQAVIWTQP